MTTATDPRRNSSSQWKWLLLLLVPAAIVAAWALLPSPGAGRVAPTAVCRVIFGQTALAARNHHTSYDRFPSAYYVDPQSQTRHSWRVKLLPYLDAAGLYAEYNPHQAWNSDDNINIANKEPPSIGSTGQYSCPSDKNRRPRETNHLMPVGKGTIFDGPTGVRLDDITDGASQTILDVETTDSGIIWTEPRDLNVDEMSCKIDDPTAPSLRSHHPRAVNVGMADGSARSLSKNIDPKVLRALLTIAGGERVSLDDPEPKLLPPESPPLAKPVPPTRH
jgi:prepilin-type processing-associated H-X9-DG protein